MDTPPADATVLFDLDGTITDSFTGIERSFRHALQAIGVAEPDDDVVAGIAGPPMLHTLRSLGLDDDQVERAFDAYRERYLDVGWLENEVFDGMSELLDDLAAADRRLAVATSKLERTAVRILEHFDLAHHFATIGGASDDRTRSAKHEVVEHVVAQVPGPYVMVGDRSYDVDGAARFDIPTVAVAWGYARPGETAHAAWRVDTVDQLRDLLIS